jgi:hypothetical protein
MTVAIEACERGVTGIAAQVWLRGASFDRLGTLEPSRPTEDD